MNIEQAFGITLRRFRQKLSLSQEKLAHLSNLDRTFISLLERGKRKPTLNTIVVISKSLNLKPHKLIQEVEKILNESK